ncbi:MAG TPA: hypothetical protein PLJ47_10415, partial [Candidatus Hydrogenedentes bacterium]|nr:hypothetical protein [Candidatus Hydrogenedentota bacterium]
TKDSNWTLAMHHAPNFFSLAAPRRGLRQSVSEVDWGTVRRRHSRCVRANYRIASRKKNGPGEE